MIENVLDALVPPWMMRSRRRRLLIFVRAVVCFSSPGIVGMLHRFSDATDFDLRRQIAELDMVVSSPSASKLLADNYVGLPLI
ncbi:MAG TPA: hypothetical protein VNT27_14700 [Propionibacteriaceae bacterium]|nr:hypothetical protein [Propionibacteriaceae bacterium]